jgi:predicted O-methyltransferase YrrM
LETLLLSVLPAKTVDSKWKLVLKPGVTYASFGSDVGTLHFYQLLVRLGRIKTVLELGTYVGVSTLFFAEAVGDKGKVTTVEFGEEFYGIAKKNFEQNGYEDRIEAIRGCAVETLKECAETGRKFDMILIDAAKERYHEMFDIAMKCLNPEGVILVDDVFFQGDSLNVQPVSDKAVGVRTLIENVAKLDPNNYSRVILPIGNGLLIVRAN